MVALATAGSFGPLVAITRDRRRCNYGRLCGVLRVDGRDTGQILIAEGLAVRYKCGAYSCPPKPGNWCSG